jgi:hypothetical protein
LQHPSNKLFSHLYSLPPGNAAAEKEEEEREEKVPHTLFRMIKNKAKVFGQPTKPSRWAKE